MWWVTSKAQNGEIRIVPILEILRKPIGTASGKTAVITSDTAKNL